jgi:UDP-glucuronate 4-epimerase
MRDEHPILVTGSAGFIGFHLSRRLLADGRPVVGFDNVNDYYDVGLKRSRLAILAQMPGFRFVEADLADARAIDTLFREESFRVVVNLAAQAGVRYSMENPRAYVDSNLVGFVNILEACRHHAVEQLIYASSSSVYGANTRMPFSVDHNVDHPLSVYAATKKANELLAHSYSHLFRLPTTGLRFFTVYGPWGRPDMAMYKFARAILTGQPLDLYNRGDMRRDFTYVDDIVECLVRLTQRPATADPDWSSDTADPATSSAPYRIYNIGNSEPVELRRVVALLESELGRKASIRELGMQPGDVPATYADVEALARAVDYRPRVSIETGIREFVRWYREYHEA